MSFSCYILASVGLPETKSYIGYSEDPFVRLLQHNGDLPDGAKPTEVHRPWFLVAVVSGFPRYFAALAFEYAWQFPTQMPLRDVMTRRGLWQHQRFLARAREACRKLWRGQLGVTAWNLRVLHCLLALADSAALRVQYFTPPEGAQLPDSLRSELPQGVVFAPLPALRVDVAARVARRAAKRPRRVSAALAVAAATAVVSAPVAAAALPLAIAARAAAAPLQAKRCVVYIDSDGECIEEVNA